MTVLKTPQDSKIFMICLLLLLPAYALCFFFGVQAVAGKQCEKQMG